VGEAIANSPKGLQGLLNRLINQTHPGSEGDACPEGTQGPIGLEEAVGRTRSREKDGLK
jgi:hypothetical protein